MMREWCDADAHVTRRVLYGTRHTSHVTRPSWQGYELHVLEGAGNLSRVAQVMHRDWPSSCSRLVVYFCDV